MARPPSKREKRKQIRRIVKLHKVLMKTYTDRPTYYAGQIRTAFEKAGIPTQFLVYAYGLYLSKAEFHDVFELKRTDDHYSIVRNDVSETHFYGDSELEWTEGVTRDFPKDRKYPQKWVPASGKGDGWRT